jgi:hypothetical protein
MVSAALRFRPLGSILRSALLSVGYTGGIQSAPNYVITNAREILHTAAANQHNRVFLQIVANPGDIRGHFDPIGKPDAGDFS